eukprot:3800082-Prymnesium_polylepis.2
MSMHNVVASCSQTPLAQLLPSALYLVSEQLPVHELHDASTWIVSPVGSATYAFFGVSQSL